VNWSQIFTFDIANLNLDILTNSLPLIRPLGPARLVLRSRRIQLWLKDESLEDSANLPDPNVIAQ